MQVLPPTVSYTHLDVYKRQLLAINENYTLTALAAAGFAFTNWTDGLGNLLTNRATLQFTMATNLSLIHI